MRHRLAIVLGLMLFLMGTLSAAAGATPPHDGVCSPLDSGKIDISIEIKEIVVTAPDGFLINEYCVKAGSANQGLGPEYVVVDPPQKTVTITHSSGKDLSHYSIGYVEVEVTTTTTPVTTTTTPVTTTTTPVTTTTTPVTTTTTPVTTTTTPVTTTTTPVTTTTTPETTTTVPEETTTTTPEKTTTTAAPECNEDSPSWNEEAQNCDPLPFTGESGIYYGGLGVAAIGILMMAYGILGSNRKEIGVASLA